jgi:hypothetical protein
VHQPFFQRKGLNIAIELRMFQGLIDVAEFDALGFVVPVYGLHTGDVPKKGRSCEAAENQDRV